MKNEVQFHGTGAASQPSSKRDLVGDGCEGCPPITGTDGSADTAQTEAVADGYVFDQFLPKAASRDNVMLSLAIYKSTLIARGWRRVYLADAITGQPGTFAQLWRVPASDLYSDKLGEIDKLPFHRSLVDNFASFERRSLNRMSYDRADRPATMMNVADGPPNVLLINTVSIKEGAMARFSCLKEKFFIGAVGAEPFRWRLVAAGAPLNGSPRTVLQMWELPDADMLAHTMRRIGQNTTYRRCLEPCIESENQQVYEVIDWS